MAHGRESTDVQDMNRHREVMLSPGHNPPRYVDRRIPTLEKNLHGYGGPGKPAHGPQGTNPWIAGSMTIGSNRVYNITLAKFQTSSANVWFKLRHSHSGTNVAAPGGTIDEWYMAAAGRQLDVADADTPLRSIRGPGTLFLYGFGAGSTLNGAHKALGTRAQQDYYSGLIRGHML